MKLRIRGWRRISAADIDTASITLLAGPNEAGKTSLLQALQVLLTGRTMPIDGLTRAAASRLVHAGSGESEIRLETPLGSTVATYPEAAMSSTGEAVTSSEYAVGLSSLLDIERKSRAEAVARLIGSAPTRDDLGAALQTALGREPGPLLDRIWQTILTSGWDGAYMHGKETGARAKGQWEQITGTRYGGRKAEDWRPAAWEADLEATAGADLSAAVSHEREWLEAAIAAKAVGESDAAKLREEVDAGKKAAKAIDQEVDEIAGLQNSRDTILSSLGKLSVPDNPKAQPCPHCGKDLAVEGGRIVVPRMLTETEIAERRRAIEEAESSLEQIQERLAGLSAVLATSRHTIEAGKRAEAKLAKAVPATAENLASIDDCRARVARAEARLKAYRDRAAALTLAIQIATNKAIGELLAPDGLRLQKLTSALAGFNSRLRFIADAAGWAPVELKHDMGISFGSWPYMLLSNGAKRIVRIVLQLATALMDGSPAVVIDDTEMLTRQNRNRMISAISAAKASVPADRPPLTVIMAAAIDRQTDVPNLGSIGGVAYWIENGTATRMG